MKSPGKTAPIVAAGTDAGGDVRRPAHDLDWLALPHIDRRHMHVVAVGMVFAGKDMPDDDAREGIADALDAFNAGARQIEAIAQRVDVLGDADVFIEPFKGNFHAGLFPFLRWFRVVRCAAR